MSKEAEELQKRMGDLPNIWNGCSNTLYKPSTIYFESKEAIEKSQVKHPEEWKTYLTYGMPGDNDED